MTAILHAQRPTVTAHRGSGPTAQTRWYRCQMGGYEDIHAGNGEPLSREFILDGVNVEVPNTYLGLGTRDAIEAAALAQCPGKALIDFWPISRPIA